MKDPLANVECLFDYMVERGWEKVFFVNAIEEINNRAPEDKKLLEIDNFIRALGKSYKKILRHCGEPMSISISFHVDDNSYSLSKRCSKCSQHEETTLPISTGESRETIKH
jgi:hypothetical protein